MSAPRLTRFRCCLDCGSTPILRVRRMPRSGLEVRVTACPDCMGRGEAERVLGELVEELDRAVSEEES